MKIMSRRYTSDSVHEERPIEEPVHAPLNPQLYQMPLEDTTNASPVSMDKAPDKPVEIPKTPVVLPRKTGLVPPVTPIAVRKSVRQIREPEKLNLKLLVLCLSVKVSVFIITIK